MKIEKDLTLTKSKNTIINGHNIYCVSLNIKQRGILYVIFRKLEKTPLHLFTWR